MLLIGMNIHRWGNPYSSYPKENLEQNLDTCCELGVDFVRYNNSCGNEEAISNVKYVAEECHKRNLEIMHVIDESSWKNADTSADIDLLEEYYENYMFRISSKLKDEIDVYQVFNEMNVTASRHGNIFNMVNINADGREKGDYDYVLWDRAIVAVRGALKGIKKGAPNAKTCVNFSWWQTAMLYEMYNQGCRFDIIGIDWYSDCEEISSIDLLIDDLKKNIPDCDIMICETNYWMNIHDRYSDEYIAELKNEEKRNEMQAKWIPQFIQKVIDMNEPRIKGIMFYELLDEPALESSAYNGEAHFGFLKCDKNGENREKKPAFYTLQKKIKDINAKY